MGHTLTWEKGRQLKSFDDNTYTYNANGIRTSKNVESGEHIYTLDGTKILQERWNYDEETKTYMDILVPLYDNEESVCGVIYNDVPYYFHKNLQGDVIAIVDKNGDTVARYTYDAWGACTIQSDSTGCCIASINPFRYRGYYYDIEIDMYYLQSRYYNPNTGRFINADAIEMLGSSGTNISYNLIVYCENEPIKGKDILGYLGLVCAMAIGAVFGVFVQYAIDVLSNFILGAKNCFKPKASLWDYITAGLSGALAATGIGKMAAVFAGALISVMNTVANNIAKGKKTNGLDVLLSAVIGAISGWIGGSGANLKKVTSVVKVSKSVLKTAVSPKKIAMYLGKIKNAAIKTIMNAIRYVFSAVAGAVGGQGKKYIMGLV